ncbi:collagen alpha-4(IV) chain-like [Tyto alba]|uniref:collagen alpha-4(IV) chain-like n=1 Tax=Tyto alba TaxID=56313 RepID=UPI001C667CED|nr:collagen alpha-4(IV) chain-like [Tyto alba]
MSMSVKSKAPARSAARARAGGRGACAEGGRRLPLPGRHFGRRCGPGRAGGAGAGPPGGRYFGPRSLSLRPAGGSRRKAGRGRRRRVFEAQRRRGGAGGRAPGRGQRLDVPAAGLLPPGGARRPLPARARSVSVCLLTGAPPGKSPCAPARLVVNLALRVSLQKGRGGCAWWDDGTERAAVLLSWPSGSLPCPGAAGCCGRTRGPAALRSGGVPGCPPRRGGSSHRHGTGAQLAGSPAPTGCVLPEPWGAQPRPPWDSVVLGSSSRPVQGTLEEDVGLPGSACGGPASSPSRCLLPAVGSQGVAFGGIYKGRGTSAGSKETPGATGVLPPSLHVIQLPHARGAEDKPPCKYPNRAGVV